MAPRQAAVQMRVVWILSAVGLGLLVAPTLSQHASAQTTPPATPPAVTEPPPSLRLIATASRGRIADLVARALAPRLSAVLAREVRVESRGDQEGRRAAEMLLAAPPDGLTILIADSRIAGLDSPPHQKDKGPALLPHLALLARLTERPLVLVTNPAQPIHRIEDFVVAARRKPNGVALSVTQPGMPIHRAGTRLDAALGGTLQLVAFPMGGASITAVLEKRAQATIATLPTALAYARKGQLRILASLGSRRHAALSHLPTLAERRIPVVASLWTAAFVHRETASETRSALSAALAQTLAARDTTAALRHLQEDAAYLAGATAQAFWERQQQDASEAQRLLERSRRR